MSVIMSTLDYICEYVFVHVPAKVCMFKYESIFLSIYVIFLKIYLM